MDVRGSSEQLRWPCNLERIHFQQLQPLGRSPPFFCLPGRSDSIRRLAALGAKMAPTHPFYAASSLDLHGRRAPFERVEDTAAYYCNEMRGLQPRGPYYLGGFCLGALVAFEMSRQLLAQGHQIALLALVEPAIDFAPFRGLKSKLNRYWYHLRHFYALKGTERWADLCERLVEIRKRSLRHRLAFCRESDEEYQAMIRRYVFQSYPGEVAIFLAADSFLSLSPSRDPRCVKWKALAQGGTEIFYFPGNHKTLLFPPLVDTLAERLKQCISRAQLSREGGRTVQPLIPLPSGYHTPATHETGLRLLHFDAGAVK